MSWRTVIISKRCIPFDLNRKSLLAKIVNTLEQQRLDTDNYIRGNQLLGEIATY